MRTAIVGAIILGFVLLGARDIVDGKLTTGIAAMLLAVVNGLLLD